MSTYMDQADKAIDRPRQDRSIDRMKQMMHYCDLSPYTLRRDKSVSDGLNGNLRLKERDFAAAGIEAGDTIHVLVERADEEDGPTVEYTTDVYEDGRGFNLPIKYRRQFDLEHGDAVRFWIERVDTAESGEKTEKDEKDDLQKQRTLSGEPVMEEPYVLIEGSNLIYHHLEEGGNRTRCGIELDSEVGYQTFSDPGDVPLDECADCMIRDSENMTNEELARWIAGELGFDIGGGPPSYFNKSQLATFRDFILEAKEAMNRLEELEGDTDDTSDDDKPSDTLSDSQ